MVTAMVKPRKQPEERRSDIFAIRVTTAQKNGIRDYAAKLGLDASDWARATLLREAGLLPKAKR
jgi:hypothetical protein